MSEPIQRRHFLKGSLGAAAAVSSYAWPVRTQARDKARGANQRINLAWIGCGQRGSVLYNHLKKISDVEVVAACDVYTPHARRAQRLIGSRCKTYRDFRQMLDRDDIDAVLIATPDHWHAIPTVLACQAGKDVYVEKPVGHNVGEGRAMVQAARRHQRIVQTGTQQRSASHFSEVRDILKSRDLGDVRFVRIWNFLNQHPDGIGHVTDGEPPEGLD